MKFTIGTSVREQANNSPIAQIFSSKTGSCAVTEVYFGTYHINPSSTSLAIGRPATAGIPQSQPEYFIAENSSYANSFSYIHTEWNLKPTSPTSFFRRNDINFDGALQLFSFYWIFPRGLKIPTNQSLVLWNLSAGGNYNSELGYTTSLETAKGQLSVVIEE